MKKLASLLVFMITLSCAGLASAEKPTITIGQPPWNAGYYIDAVAKIIIQEGYGYPVEIVDANNPAVLQAMVNNEIDIHMNVWRAAYPPYQEMTAKNQLLQAGILHEDALQGWYVPTYVIKGDPKRNIKAVAPDLKTIRDMAKYPQLFKDHDDPSKGVFYNCPPEQSNYQRNFIRIDAYGLKPLYNVVSPGSQSALEAALESAYEKGEPWFGISYSPTWVMSKFDLTRLEEDSTYKAELYTDAGGYICDMPPEQVVIATSVPFKSKAPEVYAFLEKVKIPGRYVSDMLWYMKDKKKNGYEAAVYWMQKYPGEWKAWIPADVAARVDSFLSKVK